MGWIIAAVVALVILAVIFFVYYRGAGTTASPSAPLPANSAQSKSTGA